MIYGLEITDEGRKFIEQNDNPRDRRLAPVHIAEQLSLLKAIDDPQDIVFVDAENLPSRALRALNRLVSLGYAARTDE